MADITLISGSTLGSAEYVAEHLAEKLEDAGFSTEMLHGPELDELPLNGRWLVVSSTHGAGELPDNLQPLLEQIAEQQPDLSEVQFGAVGLGSSEYDTFCGAIKQIDDLLIARGAKRIGDRLEIDVTEHEIPEDPAEEWVKNWINLL
ncbi:FMN-binding protein MioC [Serratia marcescens]|jgi:MioC protein|uniref:FMN-binding protein MioC n=2 Tax=Serratia TaxID=613 RepID=A0A9X9G2T4_9GAMM|nr:MULTISPECIES: FMN-binding protein MioC [Serratia]KAB5495231.1 FMN-binding protein MioC [Enterobacter sp. RJAL6]KLE37923.1 FMN-binding protein MioC [Serratia sp. TEL]WIF06568.1 FMN-binding protein MioC [Serratia sp. B1]SVK47030.1 bifunctional sulfite reductase flavoprotein alpha-component/iron-uptake factor [Acinetobacter baumannii]AGE20612.1 FMN-binding protein MioC [Serratia marcescens WW4]